VAEAAVPVMVIWNVPVAVALLVASVIVADPPAVTELGLIVTVEPAGPPAADNATDSALPDITVVAIVADAEEPCVTDAELGDTDMAKSFGALVTVSV